MIIFHGYSSLSNQKGIAFKETRLVLRLTQPLVPVIRKYKIYQDNSGWNVIKMHVIKLLFKTMEINICNKSLQSANIPNHCDILGLLGHFLSDNYTLVLWNKKKLSIL